MVKMNCSSKHDNKNYLTLLSRNIRSLPLHLYEVAAHEADVSCLQEANVGEHDIRRVENELKHEYNMEIVFGARTQLATDATRPGRRVAIGAKAGQKISALPSDHSSTNDDNHKTQHKQLVRQRGSPKDNVADQAMRACPWPDQVVEAERLSGSILKPARGTSVDAGS